MVAPAEAIPIAKARKHIPGRPGTSTVWRWVLYGCRGIKLDSFLVGGQRFTTRAAIEKFSRDLTAAGGRQKQPAEATPDVPKASAPKRSRRRDNERKQVARSVAANKAADELEAAGV